MRERLSAAIALADWAPQALALEIARDNEQVALQILSFCPVLDDAGLVDIVRTCGLEHRKTVAGRDNISEAVSHELVSLDDARVLAPLMDNETAKLAVADFKHALEFAAGKPELIDAVASRRDLPASLVATAYAIAGKEARDAIIARLPVQLASRMSRLASIVCADAIEDNLPEAQDDTMLSAVRVAVGGPASVLPTAGSLLALLVRGDRRGFLRGVATICDLNGPALNKKMSSADTETVALLTKAAGFEQDTVSLIWDTFCPDQRWGRDDDRVVALTWMRHSRQTARKSLQSTLQTS